MSPAAEIRLLRRLSAPGVRLLPEPGGGWAAYPGGDRRRRPLLRMAEPDIRALTAAGALAANGPARILTEAGRARLARLRSAADGDAHGAQHREDVAAAAGQRAGAVVNLAESPLRRLARPDPATGAAFLSTAEVEAGERLRADLTRSTYNARVTMDWSATPADPGARRHSARDPAGAPDSALAARQRVHAALDAVAPPLSSILLDILWREQGLDALERRNDWPRRSGKLAVKLALGRLALHYGLVKSSAA